MSELITMPGLVIARREVGDSSAYIDVLTKDFGVIEIPVRGAKKISGANLSATAVFTYSDFCVSKRGVRYALNSARIKYGFHKLSDSLEALALASYFAEVVKYTSASEQSSGDVLMLTLTALYELCAKKRAPALIKAAFEMRLSEQLGFAPDVTACAECACYGGEMYLCVKDGVMFCGECFDDSEKEPVFILTPDALKATRHTLFAPLERVYKFGVNNLRELSVVAEEYLLYHLGRGFKTLEYWRSVTGGKFYSDFT